jgi:hypothetical protein
VHRAHTLAELAAAKECVACGRPGSVALPADIGQGAAVHYLTSPLPPLRLCDRCAGEQRDAMRAGRRAVIAATLGPIALASAVAAIAPFAAPAVVPVSGLVGLVLARLVVARVRSLRAAQSRALFVDGSGEEALLQIRLGDAESDAAMPYRAESRPSRTDGVVVRPVGPEVGATLAFVASTVAVAVISVVGFVGSYPRLTIDNPLAGRAELVVTVDGVRQPLGEADAFRTRRVGYGKHRVVVDGLVHDVRVPWGENVLVSTDPTQCYEVRSLQVRRADRERVTTGPIVVYASGEEPARSRCPADP